MGKNLLRIIVAILLVAFIGAVPAEGRRKKSSRRKSRTTKVYKRSSSRRSKTRYRLPQAQPAEVAAKPQTDVQAVESVQRKADPKRKIVVSKPDLDEIRTSTLDPTSKFYFPKLMAKYEHNDTTMTSEEYRHLYLGYMFQEDFDPYRQSPYAEKTMALRSKTNHTKEEIDTITKYAQLSLQDNPFDLRQMSFLVHVLKERRKDMRAKIWEYRLEHLLGAIKSTGNGENVENAWYVIYPMHEYDMVQLLGYEATDADFIEPGYDYLSVRPDESDTRRRDKSAKGFYFNVIVPQEQYELKHPEETPVSADDIPAE